MLNKLNELKNKKVLVVGDILLDHYINVTPKKISEEAPLLIFNYEKDYYSLGGCANVSKYIASFECDVDLIGVLGNDNNSNIVIELLKKNNINCKYIIKNNEIITTIKTRLYSSDNKQVLRLDNEESNANYGYSVVQMLKTINKIYDLIIISDYNKGVITKESYNEIIKISKEKNIPVICDPKNFTLKFNDLFVLKPNKNEMGAIINCYNDEKIINYKITNNIKNVVLTLGKDGMKVFDENNNIHNIEAHKNVVYDVTGAGDSVLSYLALGVLLNINFLEVCKLANYAASVKVSKFGTELVSIDEILPFFTDKVISRDNLKTFSKLLHKNNKIVFTNGCFDIVHSGHIHNLKSAKKEGDILVLGLNSDSSIKKLKGSERPILSEKERIDILSSMEFIDYIVVFDEETPLNIINDIKPDVLVKGSDYKDKFIVGKKEVEEYGGKVVLVDLVLGKSTTNIVERIKGGK